MCMLRSWPISIPDLKGAMDNLVQQKDLKVLVTDIVQKLLTNFEEKITKKIEHVIWERTGKLQDQLRFFDD
jgi:hypothetical protein